MLESGFKELFLVGATNNLPTWGTIDYNASAKTVLPEQCPVSADYAIHGLHGTIRPCQK